MSKKIQLYSLATPNGRKVSIALEEMELAYDAHTVNILEGEQFKEFFVNLNPNSKIPVIVDPEAADGKEQVVFESGAILLYLAEKTGKFLSTDPRKRNETIQWLFFQMASVGPMFGQFGHFYKYAKDKCQDPYPRERYANEVKRLLKVLDKRLEGRKFIIDDDYSIADMAVFPWVGCLDWGYEAREFLEVDSYKNVVAWHDRCASRPKALAGANVCPFERA
ncbi:MAG: glutathione binding-like protein [Bacteriovoracaceae bacterium]